MKNAYLFLSVSIILGIAAFILAINNIHGWGWFLLGSLLTFVYPKSKKE